MTGNRRRRDVAGEGLVFWLLASICLAGAELPVTEFGAVPNDSGVDTSAFSAAIAQARPGDTVTIPEGTFLLDARIDLKTGIHLRGAGPEMTRLLHAGKASHCFIRISDSRDLDLSGFALDGRDSPMAQQGIVVTKSDALFLHHLRIENFVDTGTFGPHGILSSGTSNMIISDNTIRNIAPEDPWGAGIRLGEPCSGNRVERNEIHNTGRGGIFTNNGAGDAVIRENVITGSHGIAFAIEIHSRSVRTVVEDNIVDHGLSIVSANCAVRRNIVIDPQGTWGAYGIEGGGGPDGIVTDNIIDYGQKQGISISGPQRYMLWARNSFVNCSTWGIQLQGPAEDNRIRCLYFYRNRFCNMKRGHPSAQYPGHDGHAIRFNNHVEYVTFDGNTISDNGGLGIQITSGKDVNHLCFIDNIISGNAMGVISPYPGDVLVWRGNLVSGNGGPAEDLADIGEGGIPPTAAISAPVVARVGENVEFRSVSTLGSAEIDHVLWDFGAGIPANTSTAVHVYEKPGAYLVSLVVWDKDGRGARPAEHTIRISTE